MEEEQSPPSTGFWWSILMLALIMAECLALAEVVFGDMKQQGWDPWAGFTGPYFVIIAVTCLFQLGGILSVSAGWFRLGGVLQIIGSSVHVLKGEGLIGVFGGMTAYRYPSKAGAITDKSSINPPSTDT